MADDEQWLLISFAEALRLPKGVLDDFLFYADAIKLVRSELGVSPGKAHAVLRAACASGEIRCINYCDLPPAYDLKRLFYSREDLSEWLGRREIRPPSEPATEKDGPKVRQAKAMIRMRWPEGVPSEDVLASSDLCRQVNDQWKIETKNQDVEYSPLDRRTILRAAGRGTK
jgi:hypothetical protein